ncbi:MAG: hypothetical protein TREMPRED_004229 [Tremellales sp. Tagirdzhanova-0007]|nr:MAG: hypothetical protein TREMPRED_004229 [Tremellales sp. Tagirdzhanova-0007]
MSLFQPPIRSGLLEDMLRNPLVFGEVVRKGNWAASVGTREVTMGPRSPPRRALMLNGSTKPPSTSDDAGSPSTTHIVTPPSTPRAPIIAANPTSPTSDRKGKSTISPQHTADIDLSWPPSIAGLRRPAAGLYNPSMACYANATLQILLHTPPVLRIAQKHNPSECLQRTRGFCMLCLLRDMAVDHHWSGAKSYQPIEAHKNLGHIKKGFSRNQQEDAHEFFRFVTDGLQTTALARQPRDLSEKKRRETWIHRVWGGMIRSRVTCTRCSKSSDTFDSFLDLSIDVHPSKRTLLSMLHEFVREDRLEGDNKYHCGNCKSKSVATKSFKIARAPPILTLHLKRFSVDYNTYNGKARADKFNHHIEFGEGLDLSPYIIEPKGKVPPSSQGGSDSKEVGGARYRLFGVTCHRGVELRYGHYTSYVRAPNGAWYEADDEDMTAVPITKVLGDRTAYLLSYIRMGNGENGLTDKTPSSVNVSRPLQTAVSANGSRPGLLDSSRLTPSINGHRITPIANGYSLSSKRKLEDDFLDKADRQAKRLTPSSIVHASPGFGSRSSSHSPPERTPSKFGYSPKQHRDIPAQNRQVQEYQHHSPHAKRRRSHPGGDRGGARRSQAGAGAPMPFQQGNYGRGGTTGAGGGGFGARAPGAYGRMKGRP